MIEDKLKKIRDAGLGQLHVICDFDRTMTVPSVGSSSFSPVRRLGFMPEEYGEKAWSLYHHYHPMELDNQIPHDEKFQIMHEWWEAQLLLMINYGLNRNDLEGVKGAGMIQLRKGVVEFFKALDKKGVPVLVLSAGFGDIIEMVLDEAGIYFDNVHVVANFLEYDEKGNAVAYRAPIVHGMNKCEQDLGPYRKLVENRHNVLLVGDMVGDANMADGLPHDEVLKVGFFNNGPDPQREKDLNEAFDVVLEGNGSWEGVNDLYDMIRSS